MAHTHRSKFLSRAALAGLALSALVADATPGLAQTNPSRAGCGERTAVVERLAREYGERPLAYGLADFGHIVEVFVADDGRTWTILVTRADGVSCLAAAGRDWQGLSREGGEQTDS